MSLFWCSGKVRFYCKCMLLFQDNTDQIFQTPAILRLGRSSDFFHRRSYNAGNTLVYFSNKSYVKTLPDWIYIHTWTYCERNGLCCIRINIQLSKINTYERWSLKCRPISTYERSHQYKKFFHLHPSIKKSKITFGDHFQTHTASI